MAAQKQYLNSTLQGLPPGEFASVASELKEVELSKGAVLFERDTIAPSVFYPIDSVISFLGDTGKGGSIEVWAVGSEGLAGIRGLLGKTKPFRGVVQVPGTAYVSKASMFRKSFQHHSAFHDAVLAYYDDLLLQISYL